MMDSLTMYGLFTWSFLKLTKIVKRRTDLHPRLNRCWELDIDRMNASNKFSDIKWGIKGLLWISVSHYRDFNSESMFRWNLRDLPWQGWVRSLKSEISIQSDILEIWGFRTTLISEAAEKIFQLSIENDQKITSIFTSKSAVPINTSNRSYWWDGFCCLNSIVLEIIISVWN